MPVTVRMDPAVPLRSERPGDEDGEPTVAIAGRQVRQCPTCKASFSDHSRFCPYDGDPLIAIAWTPQPDPLIGRVVDGRYEIVSVLGEGGMGTVYEVKHATLGRRFALKVLRRDLLDKDLGDRFIREAKAAGAIGHPNIVAVTDFGTVPIGTAEAVPYFVMELLGGASLAERLRESKTLTPRATAKIVLECAIGLGAAHAAGVIHRDLKPDNIFLVTEGDREYVKLLDFGVAKMAGSGKLTKAGMVFGTPHYMSPEQAQGQTVDPRSDVYALGVILYECISGRVPFEADTFMGVLTQHNFAVPQPLEEVVDRPSLTTGIAPIVNRCLAKSPDERYADMAELAAALRVFLNDPERAAGDALGRPKSSGMHLRDAETPLTGPSLPPLPTTDWSRYALYAGIAVAVVAVATLAAMLVRGAPPAPIAAPAATQTAAPAAVAPEAPPTSTATTTATAATAPKPPEPAATSPRSAKGREAPPPRPRTTAGKHETGRPSGDVVDPWAKH